MQAVTVPARIAADNAVQVLADLREATRGVTGEALALDLSPLREFDSAALSLLLQLARDRTASAAGGSSAAIGSGSTHADPRAASATSAAPVLFLLNPPEKLRKLAELYGVVPMLFGGSGDRSNQPNPL